MKNIFILTIAILTLSIYTHAQNNFITYQGVASKADGSLIKDRNISLLFEISENAEVLFAEIHNTTTSPLGVFSVYIGNGLLESGNYASIDWRKGNQVLTIYIDPLGDDNFKLLGESSFSTVPYAIYGQDEDADPENEIQGLYSKVVGPNTVDIFITGSKDSVRISAPTAKMSSQKRASNHDPLGITDIWLTSNATNVVSVDSDPNNEFQTLSAEFIKDPFQDHWNTELTLRNNSDNQFHNVLIEDTDPDNEKERLVHRVREDVVTQAKVTELRLVNNDGATLDSFIIFDTDHLNEIQELVFSLKEGPNGSYGDLALSKNPGVSPIILPDLDPTNEIQNLNYSDGVLSISGGNEIEIPIGQNSSPWEYVNNMNISWPYRISIGEVISEGVGQFNNIYSMNNMFSHVFRSFNGSLMMSNDYIKLGDDFSVNNQGYMFVKEIAAEIKNFRMDHPEDPTKEIYYVSLEGPEAGAYERGTAQLKNGEAFISYSDHFQLVIGDNQPTVILTPQSIETYGLAVVEKTSKGFRVKELMHGKGNFNFDWEVKAVRAGYENYEVVRDKK